MIEKTKKIIKKNPIYSALILSGIFLFLIIIFFISLSWWYEDKIFPGVVLGKDKYGGKVLADAQFNFKERASNLRVGLGVNCSGRRIMIEPVVASKDGVVAVELYTLNDQVTWQQLVSLGRNGNFFHRLKERVGGVFSNNHLDWNVKVNEVAIADYLKEKCSDLEKPVKDADIFWQDNGWQIADEAIGETFDYLTAAKTIANNLRQGENTVVEMELNKTQPQITKAVLATIQPRVNKNVLAEKISNTQTESTIKKTTLNFEDKQWELSENNINNFLSAKWIDNKIVFDFSKDKIGNYLKEKVSPKIDYQAEQPKFEMKNGRATTFQPGKNGRELDISSSTISILEGLNNNTTTINLIVKDIIEESYNEESLLNGIKELIGTGISDFSGSSNSRRHNIRVGANTINGLIIKPDEVFSLVGALGKIDASSGYRTELVIKENKTVPEYGGGLCQVGTTLFRAVFNSGLPVIERRNHSYRVQYYEPAGTDATIYSPSPDFKFKNDTGNNLLIQTRVEGNKAIFEFWGTKDGRKVEYTKPKIYNIVRPPAAKLIEVDTLKPGIKKCTERAHNGADAFFNYKVSYPDGSVKDKTFYSHYVPWQEVCLIGKNTTTSTISEVVKE